MIPMTTRSPRPRPDHPRRPRPGLRSVFADRVDRRLFAAQTISRWGDTFNTVAWPCSCSP
jgi:hypothetical protein